MATSGTVGKRTRSILSPAALINLMRGGGGPRIIDVRTPGEFQTFHIPGSCNVPLAILHEYRPELLRHLDEDVVLVCHAGVRAAQAEQALDEAGLPNLRVLEGGIVAYEAAGGPVTRGEPRWDLERQIRLIVGSLVLITGLLGLWISGLHLIGTAVGAALVFAAVTNTCGLGVLLSKLPYNRGPRLDVKSVITSLSARHGGRPS